MKTLYSVLNAAERGAALVAAETFKGRDFMGWRAMALAALRCPADNPKGDVVRALYCDLGGVAWLAEHQEGHPLSDRPQLAIECRNARQKIAEAYGLPIPL